MVLQGKQQCKTKCPQLFGRTGLWTDKYQCYGWTPSPYIVVDDIDTLVDRNGWCKSCNELETKCTECDQNVGCTTCSTEAGTEWPATYLNAGYGLCHSTFCAERLSLDNQELCGKCWRDPTFIELNDD